MKVCPECNNLASPKAMMCGYCGKSLVGIQEESFEIANDLKEAAVVRDKSLVANIYGNNNALDDKKYKIKRFTDSDTLYSNNKSIYLLVAILFLFLPLVMTFDRLKNLNILNLIAPISLSIIFFIIAFIKFISNKNKILIAFFSLSVFLGYSFFFVSSVEEIAFVNRNLYIPYDLDARGLSVFFYISIFASFISSSLKNSIYALIAIVISIISMLIVFFYTPHLEYKEMLIFQVYMDYELIPYIFKISPLIIIITMIISVGDIYYRIILQYFLIIFLSYQYYGYLLGLHYSIIDSIFMAKDFILYIVGIYLFSFFLYSVIIIGLPNIFFKNIFLKLKKTRK